MTFESFRREERFASKNGQAYTPCTKFSEEETFIRRESEVERLMLI